MKTRAKDKVSETKDFTINSTKEIMQAQQIPTKNKSKKKIKKLSADQQKKDLSQELSQSQQNQVKITKPKKYLNKNYEQIARIARSQYQKIYLLEAERDEEEAWSFVVQGTSGKNYNVNVHSTGLNCTCTDFKIKKKPCKHIYFIVTQVAQNPQILDYFSNSTKISKAAYSILDDQLSKRLKSRMEKPQENSKEKIDLKDDTDCTICFTEMDKEAESLEGCSTCKKYFHFECLQAWKKHNPTCPLCRSPFANFINSSDPLNRFTRRQMKNARNIR